VSQTLGSKKSSNRRSFLTFAVTAAAIVPLSETVFALDNHQSANVIRVISGRELRFKWTSGLFASALAP
jgi:hypothetical protein